MKKQNLSLVIILVAISLTGLILTQILWLRKSVSVSEKQYDDRADRMLEDVLSELEQFRDTFQIIKNIPANELRIFNVVDTSLLFYLIDKYVNYHRLDPQFQYALLRSSDDSIIFKSADFQSINEKEAYKTCLSCIWKKEYIHLSVYFPGKKLSIYRQLLLWVVLSFIFLLIISGAFIFIIYSILQQKKISEIRNDFINNMTHEFKTPISTISLASEILLKDAKNPSAQRVGKYSKIIYEENQRMQTQVELVLQKALIDRKQLKLKKEKINLHNLIESVIVSFSIEAQKKNAQFELNLSASAPEVIVDSVHMRNVFTNLFDNALKYSNDDPIVHVKTNNNQEGIVISITDNGKGISREAQKRIFDKFYRVSTGDLHDVKGFGLGLYYVKTMIEAHQGSVYVDSSLNKGSTFYVYLPTGIW